MKNYTNINVLLDRSGSMSSVRDETINGFNVFLNDQKAQGDNASITLVQFDSGGIDTIMDAVPINSSIELSLETYVPRGMTPLLDALGKTIVEVGNKLEKISEEDKPDKIVFVIITDGYENASREYNKDAIRKMIDVQQSIYKWQFIYLGANQDAFSEAGAIGINQFNSATYDTKNMSAVYMSTSNNIRAYRESNKVETLGFSEGQKNSLVN